MPRTRPVFSKGTVVLQTPHLKEGKERQAPLGRPDPWASPASACELM